MPIKANELRIGNWVLVDGKNIQVESVDDNGINQELSSGWYGECQTEYKGYFEEWWGNEAGLIQPIPLTNDILLKCGFKNSVGNNYHYKNCRIWFTDERVFFFINYKKGDDSFSIRKEIKYLHQLQNLYFSLIGEELEIKF